MKNYSSLIKLMIISNNKPSKEILKYSPSPHCWKKLERIIIDSSLMKPSSGNNSPLSKVPPPISKGNLPPPSKDSKLLSRKSKPYRKPTSPTRGLFTHPPTLGSIKKDSTPPKNINGKTVSRLLVSSSEKVKILVSYFLNLLKRIRPKALTKRKATSVPSKSTLSNTVKQPQTHKNSKDLVLALSMNLSLRNVEIY